MIKDDYRNLHEGSAYILASAFVISCSKFDFYNEKQRTKKMFVLADFRFLEMKQYHGGNGQNPTEIASLTASFTLTEILDIVLVLSMVRL